MSENKNEEKIVEDEVVINSEAILNQAEVEQLISDDVIEVDAENVVIEESNQEEPKGEKYIALVSFAGIVTMHKNEERVLNNKDIIKDLLKAKYIKKVK